MACLPKVLSTPARPAASPDTLIKCELEEAAAGYTVMGHLLVVSA